MADKKIAPNGATAAPVANGPAASNGSKGPGKEQEPRARGDPQSVQGRWLAGALGQTVKVRLLDGKVLTGKLKAFDMYSLELRPAEGASLLIYKQAVAYVAPEAVAQGKTE